MSIPVIDIFAGPGGLGEGFSSLVQNEERVFDIRLSIEKDEHAHKTLELRSFFRCFPVGQAPKEYYELLQESNLSNRETLKASLFEKYVAEAETAKNEAWCATLGGDDFPESLVDERIRQAIDGAKDWVLIGGPPCQAYSLVGRSRRQWGSEVDTEDERVHLYKEYLRIIAAHHPAVFVMENVKGLLSSKLNGEKVFDLIKQDLKRPDSVFPGLNSPAYKVYSLTAPSSEDEKGFPIYEKDMDYLIRAEEYGIPQKRHRVILLGVRDDINAKPDILIKKDEVTLEQVIGNLPKIRSGLNRSLYKTEIIGGKKRRFYKNEEDSDSNWERMVHSFRKEIISWNGFAKDYSTADIASECNGVGAEFLPFNLAKPKTELDRWYHDPEINGVCNHESRAHLTEDLKRYMFSSMFAKTYNRFPRLHEFEQHSEALLPDHENVNSGKFSDRFRVQLADQPATTITSHISKDGHYFIHYDPDQCRSLTVREAARIQTFPDNYLFCGSRTAQYHQVGNAVPPYLAKQIGEVVFTLLRQDKNNGN